MSVTRGKDEIMSMSTTTRKRTPQLHQLTHTEKVDRLSRACHEVGHGIATVVTGGIVRECVMTGGPGGAGMCRYTADPKRDGEIVFAGPVAESLYLFGPHPTVDQLTEVMMTSGEHDRAALLSANEAWPMGIVSSMRTLWPVVKDLAPKLYARNEIKHSDICAALGIPMVGGGMVASLTARDAVDRLLMRCPALRPSPHPVEKWIRR
ncbi:hypothetical protein [Rhodococcus koreensis]